MDIFDTLTLLGVLRVQKPPTTYWLDSFFPRTVTFLTEEIMFDTVIEPRRLAPFVAPNVQGRVMKRQGFSTKTFRPAYTKPKHIVDPSQVFTRTAGEAIAGSLSPDDRYNARVAENLALEKTSIVRLWDWMAARAVVDGAVTVAGDDYPSVTVDFGRDAGLSVQLTGTARWSQIATADPLTDIDHLRQLAFTLGRGAITRVTFGLNAWGYFVQNERVKTLLNTLYRGSETSFNTALTDPAPYNLMGVLMGQGGAGRLELYTYNDKYEDENGTEQPYMDQDTVVGTGPNIAGIQCFGAIRDRKAGLAAMDMFPRMWDNEDPSVTYTMTQSAPLMVPSTPNGSFKIKTV